MTVLLANSVRRNSFRLLATGAITLSLLTAACVPNLPVQSEDSENSRLRMFAAGLSDIDKVYLDAPDMTHLAVAGLEGLRQIEPGLFIREGDGETRLSIGAANVYSAKTPNDPNGWAAYFVTALERAAGVSVALEHAQNEKIFNAVFNNVSRKLDPYSRYASAKKAAANRIKRQGFGGIGVSLKAHPKGATILKLAPGLPAEKSKLKVGDIIITIGDSAVAGFSVAKIRDLIRGPVNVPVSVRILRPGQSAAQRYLLERARITAKTVFDSYHKGIGVFRINGFNRDTASALERALSKAQLRHGKKMRGIVLDLRNNPGGLLDQAVDIADLFLQGGQIIATKGRHKNSLQDFQATPGDILEGLPIAVLINGATASAAEILAAALQDNGRAVVIGSSSFGKGTVQTVLRLPNDGEFILTWALIVAPSGYALQKLGVIPTVCTAGKSNAQLIIKQFQKGDFERSRTLLRLRRAADFRDPRQQRRIKKLCPWRPNRDIGLDRRVAELMLRAQDRYARAANLARVPSGS